MNENEEKLFEKLGECWNDYSQLPKEHPSDLKEFEFHVHALQNIVLSRPTYRNYLEKIKNNDGYNK